MADDNTLPVQTLPGGPPEDDSKRPVELEIATAVRNFFEPVFNGLLQPNDDTLLTRGNGRGLKIYDELERDPHCAAVLQKRRLALVSRDWDLQPGGTRAIDRAAAAFVKAQFEALPFDSICNKLLDALLKGFAVGEVIWKVDGSTVSVEAIRARSQRRFVFDYRYDLRLLTLDEPVYGISLPERKFVVHRFGEKDDNPYGLGLGTRLFWPVFFKRQGIQFWLTFCDKFGNPTAVGKYPSGASAAAKNTLLAALQAISQEAQIAVPVGMEISLLEAQRSGATGTYEGLCRYMDEEISKAVLGETMSTSAHGHSGGLGSSQANVQNEVRLEITRADGDLLTGSLQPLCKWITAYNFPTAKPPKVVWDVSAPADLLQRAQIDQIVAGMGFEPSLEYIQETYDSGWTKKVVQPPRTLPGVPGAADASPPDGADAAFAAPGQPDRVDGMLPQMARMSDLALRGWIGAVRKIVDEASDMADVRDRLMQAYPQMSLTELAQGMEAAFAAAQLAGRYDILQQAGG